MAGTLIAQFELTNMQAVFYFVLRIVVAAACALIGLLLAGPLSSILHRMAFQKPITKGRKFLARVIGALLLGLLAFFLLPLIGGGFGSGGPNTGSGEGKNGKTNGKSDPAENKKKKKPETDKTKLGVLRIEIIAKKKYKEQYEDTGKYYLIDGKEPPKTFEEIKTLLAANQDRFDQIDIILSNESYSKYDRSVTDLQSEAERLKIKAPIVPKGDQESQ